MTGPEHLYRPDLITQRPEWLVLNGGVQSAVSTFVTRLRPLPGAFDPARRDPIELRSRYLLKVATDRATAEHLERLAVTAGRWAIHYGATPEQLAVVDGTTPEQAAERYAIPENFRGQDFLPQRPEWATESDAACPGGDQA
ncbi:hypothetical protein [Cryptosporangium aurantiacum]|uniref:Uncharacterized protein n=1 Tax=Cryptosporangium aurantiacum TaxID=134849 RepID=A0A1M7RDF8_9ACTN|nr:hypothetical protein [Cryptosporangium aurantiacum]SHN44078.1 hypothetical protein SAMN05443668_11047 [Cryptosporangium aurantiacum]